MSDYATELVTGYIAALAFDETIPKVAKMLEAHRYNEAIAETTKVINVMEETFSDQPDLRPILSLFSAH